MLKQLRRHALTGTALWDDHWRTHAAVRADARSLRWDGILDLVDRRIPHGPMLEAGCGLGRYLEYIRARGGAVTGIDFVLDPLRAIRARTPACLAVADLGALPFADGAFPTILCLGLLEHFESSCDRELSELRRVLAPGGHLVVTVPFANWLKRRRASTGGPDVIPGSAQPPAGWSFYQYCFSMREAVALLERSGLEVIRTRRVSRLFWLLGGRRRPATPASAAGESKAAAGDRTSIRQRAVDAAFYGQWLIPGALTAHMIALVAVKRGERPHP